MERPQHREGLPPPGAPRLGRRAGGYLGTGTISRSTRARRRRPPPTAHRPPPTAHRPPPTTQLGDDFFNSAAVASDVSPDSFRQRYHYRDDDDPGVFEAKTSQDDYPYPGVRTARVSVEASRATRHVSRR